MQNMQNMQWNVTDIFCILSIFQHIPTYWSAYFQVLAYSNIYFLIFPHHFSCIFLHIFLLSSQWKLVIKSQNTGYISPENRFIVARQDFFQVLIRQVRISCWFEYDHTIIVTCKRKRKVMICIICIICTKIMNMHIYAYNIHHMQNMQHQAVCLDLRPLFLDLSLKRGALSLSSSVRTEAAVALVGLIT